jgi:hypothetical protein
MLSVNFTYRETLNTLYALEECKRNTNKKEYADDIQKAIDAIKEARYKKYKNDFVKYHKEGEEETRAGTMDFRAKEIAERLMVVNENK